MNSSAHRCPADLYLRYGAVIFARCRQLLADEKLAEHATQEIFMRVRPGLQATSSPQEALRSIYRALNAWFLERTPAERTRQAPLNALPD